MHQRMLYPLFQNLRSALQRTVCGSCGQDTLQSPCPECMTPDPMLWPPMTMTSGIFACYTYTSPAGDALRASKRLGDRRALVRLAENFSRATARSLPPWDIDFITPVPSHWRTRLQRGFNPPSILAIKLSEELGLPIRNTINRRAGGTQKGLTRVGRLNNAASKFRAKEHAIVGSVLLVDDVITTGATLNACAGELLASGACSVYAAVLCGTNRNQLQHT